MLRPPTENDLDAMLELLKMMHAESEYRSLPMDDAKVRKWLILAMDKGFIRVHESEGLDGIFMAMLSEYWFNHEVMASDLVLFVKPESRGKRIGFKLIRAYVDWANACRIEAHLSISTGVEVESTGRLYEKFGFQNVGGNYRRINHV